MRSSKPAPRCLARIDRHRREGRGAVRNCHLHWRHLRPAPSRRPRRREAVAWTFRFRAPSARGARIALCGRFRAWVQRFLLVTRHRYGQSRAWQVTGTSLRAIRWFVGDGMLCVLADACGELFRLLGPLLRDARLVGICKLHAPTRDGLLVGRPSHSGETALQIIGGDRLVRGRPRVRRAFGCFVPQQCPRPQLSLRR